MSFLYLFFLIYSALFIVVCKLSYKNGLLMFWGSLFVVPSLLLSSVPILSYITLITLQILIISCLNFRTIIRDVNLFFTSHKKVVYVYIVYTGCSLLFSEKVPWNNQLYFVFNEILFLLVIFQTYNYTVRHQDFIRPLILMLGGLVILNFCYSVIFEIVKGENIVGEPLYYLLGNEDNLIDMSNVERGLFSFRLQSIYGHPLSLGQYFLLLFPVFLLWGRNVSKIFYGIVVIIVILIFMTGTRGAIVPMFLLLVMEAYHRRNEIFLKLFFFLFAFVLVYELSPYQYQKQVDDYMNNSIASLQFWDDRLQASSNISGSSMKMRIEQAEAAMDEVQNCPLWGNGKGYREYYQRKYKMLHPRLLGYESFFLLKLVEEGWLGLIFFMMMIGYIYSYFKKRARFSRWITYVFIVYFLSTLMTGIRPHSLLIMGLSFILISSCVPNHRQTLNY